jgi:beta-phosphoglucomutase family hydrolase
MTVKVHPEAKALIFDLDGTLSNSLPVHVETWNKIGDKYNFTFDLKIVEEMTGRPTIEFAKRIVNQYALSEEPQNIVNQKQKHFWELAHLLKPVEEIRAIVEEYYGKLPLAVGTGASRKSAVVQLNELNLIHYFDAIVSADDVKNHKPEPDTFLECARIMEVEPQFCQVFEDGDLGILAAQKAGMIVTDVRPHINYGEWVLS